jgi:hypothetical protein
MYLLSSRQYLLANFARKWPEVFFNLQSDGIK